ncbi:MAG: hypothetical protein IPI18_05080 [Saprospiraceae bacterium]|nr:hypothetical protein [Saprospiraceae bacterium]
MEKKGKKKEKTRKRPNPKRDQKTPTGGKEKGNSIIPPLKKIISKPPRGAGKNQKLSKKTKKIKKKENPNPKNPTPKINKFFTPPNFLNKYFKKK